MGKRIRGNTQAGRNYLFMDESSEKLLKEHPGEPPPIEGSISTTIDYSLRLRNTPPPSAGQLVAVAVAAAGYTILSWLSASLLSSGIPVAAFFFVAIGFGVPFRLLFGGRAFVFAFFGDFVGAG